MIMPPAASTTDPHYLDEAALRRDAAEAQVQLRAMRTT